MTHFYFISYPILNRGAWVIILKLEVNHSSHLLNSYDWQFTTALGSKTSNATNALKTLYNLEILMSVVLETFFLNQLYSV